MRDKDAKLSINYEYVIIEVKMNKNHKYGNRNAKI